MFKFQKLVLPKGNRMLRIGLGQHEGQAFFRIDLWWIGFRIVGKNNVETPKKPQLKVWYGSMPESNGKSNWTVLLHPDTSDNPFWDSFTVHQSEYEDRARYDYDTLRYMLGEIDTKPCILDYDADLKSSYDETLDPKWYMP